MCTMNDSTNLNLIVVGCGKWGTNLIKTAHALHRLVAIVDSNISSVQGLRERVPTIGEIPAYSTLLVALKDHINAAVIVATPPSTHFTVAMEALRANRHVFVEKPICDSLEDARTLVSEARTRDLVLMVDHLLQYSLPHRRLLHLVTTGYVGTVNRVRMCRMNFGTIRTAEDVLWSFCPHDLSILLSLLQGGSGEANINEIRAMSVTCNGQSVVSQGVSDYVDVSVAFSSGAQAQVEASWLHPLKERRVIVYGTKGSIILNEAMPDPNLPRIQAFRWSAKPRADNSTVDIEKFQDDLKAHLAQNPEDQAIEFASESQPLRSALEHFLNCCESGAVPRTNGEEALRVLELLDAATLSLKNNGMPNPMQGDAMKQLLQSNGGVLNPSNSKKNANGNAKTRTSEVVDIKEAEGTFIHASAIVDNGANIGQGTKVWHFTHVMSGAKIGQRCNIGQNVFVGSNAVLGNGVKVQNNVSIYDAVRIEDDVFLGPSCVLTNVKTPRAHVSRKHAFSRTLIQRGVTVGANATIVCGITLGAFCFVGAGAVVTKDIPSHALVYGNPAAVQGWVSTTGIKLEPNDSDGTMRCPESEEVYKLERNGNLESPKLIGPL